MAVDDPSTDSTDMRRRRAVALRGILAAPFLCLFAPFAVFLIWNDYPILSAEVLILGLALLVPGLLAYAIARRAGPLAASPIIFLCLLLAILLQYRFATLGAIVAVALIAMTVVLLAGRSAGILVSVLAGTHIAMTILLATLSSSSSSASEPTVAGPSVPPSGELPPVVHIVLDELIGLHGLPDDVAAGRAARSEMADFFLENEFTVFEKAYSQYLRTINSLPNLFNFSSETKSEAQLSISPSGVKRLEQNRYFDYLTDRGYALRVYQTDYMDLCGLVAHRCATYALNSPKAIRRAGIDVWQRALFLRNSLIDSSSTIRMLRSRYLYARADNPKLPAWPAGNSKTGPLAAIDVVADLTRDLENLHDGEAYVAHLMVPHFPYVYSKDCSVIPVIGDWLNRVPFDVADRLDDAIQGLGAQNTASSRELRYARYLEQVTCTTQILSRIFAAIRESGSWDQATIVIHGDHGPRIFEHLPAVWNVHELQPADFRDAYSTLFAVKSPEHGAGIEPEALPLQVLLARTWSLPEPSIDSDTVYLFTPSGAALQRTGLVGFDGEGRRDARRH